MEKLIRLHTPDNGVTFNCQGEGRETNLVYDERTKIVYYKFEEFKGNWTFTGFMSPYISENGKFCRFIDNQIVGIG